MMKVLEIFVLRYRKTPKQSKKLYKTSFIIQSALIRGMFESNVLIYNVTVQIFNNLPISLLYLFHIKNKHILH